MKPLPRSSYRLDPERLRERLNSLASQRKNTVAVARLHALAVAAKIRKEVKEHGVAA